MKPTKIAALVMAGMALAGMTYAAAGQRAFAHSFTEDESASFLVNVMAAKVHLMLVGKNLDNPEAALAHIDHVHMIIDDEMLNEIAEQNERISADIPAALDDLAAMVESGEERSVIIGQFREISSLLAEAVSVRIDSEHVSDPHVQALIVAGLADNALASYEQAHGLGEHMMDDGQVMEEDHAMEGDHVAGGDIVDHDAYVAAKAFATLAKNTFYREHLVDEGTEVAHDVQSGLVELREAMYAGHSVEDVTVAVHIGVHEKLREAYGLEIEGHATSEEESGDHMDEGAMDDHMEGQ
ncbi:MAG: hypothetical protein QXJ74_01195 [Nitrososphaera sp.]